jgi:pentose-5-phosphate-3-epimerase
MAEIIPAILAKSADELREKLSSLPDEIQMVHIDVLEEDVCGDYTKPFEAHLMVSDPLPIIKRWINRGAKRIIVHKLSQEILNFKRDVEIGLGVEMSVPMEHVLPLSRDVSFVQLMSIAKMGEQGHPLDERIFDRIKELRKIYPTTVISVDGGVNASNFPRFVELGVDRVVIGSHFNEVWTSQMKKS